MSATVGRLGRRHYWTSLLSLSFPSYILFCSLSSALRLYICCNLSCRVQTEEWWGGCLQAVTQVDIIWERKKCVTFSWTGLCLPFDSPFIFRVTLSKNSSLIYISFA